ncbi:hypothetical protein HWV62_43371 [Athelia sp. TMB]|nr:hypothetical protein HWV62_43371 [Athelia sp. TMB]
MEVGDYVTVDRKPVVFNKHGKIYEDNLIPDFTDKDEISQHQNGERRQFRDYLLSSNVAGVGDVALTGTWEFNGERGAMKKLLDRLANVKAVEGKYLVSEAYMCPAASLYLSNKSDKEVTLKLHGKVNAPVATFAAGVPVGVGATGNYTTLSTLKKRRWYGGYRGVPQKPINPDEDKWETLEDVPWGAIDSDDEDDEEDDEQSG